MAKSLGTGAIPCGKHEWFYGDDSVHRTICWPYLTTVTALELVVGSFMSS